MIRDELETDRELWPQDHGPAVCELRGCGLPADPRAVAEHAYVCTDHLLPSS